jgi:hypothetical protein
MNQTKAARADWEARFRVAGSVYSQADCGCVVWVCVDMPEELAYAAKDMAAQVAKGREIKRAPRSGLPEFECPTHYQERHPA